MGYSRVQLFFACAASGLGMMGARPAPLVAQTFVEVGGGWNYVAPAPSSTSYGNGFNVRLSIGRQLDPMLSLRFDALSSQFDAAPGGPQPCPNIGCSGPGYSFLHEEVNALTGSALVNVTRSGHVYLIGGGGLYGVHTQTNDWHFGVSAGGGINIPLAAHLQGIVEARWHYIVGAVAGPQWLVPITVGLRY